MYFIVEQKIKYVMRLAKFYMPYPLFKVMWLTEAYSEVLLESLLVNKTDNIYKYILNKTLSHHFSISSSSKIIPLVRQHFIHTYNLKYLG